MVGGAGVGLGCGIGVGEGRRVKVAIGVGGTGVGGIRVAVGATVGDGGTVGALAMGVDVTTFAGTTSVGRGVG
jgi:hypothetical protein